MDDLAKGGGMALRVWWGHIMHNLCLSSGYHGGRHVAIRDVLVFVIVVFCQCFLPAKDLVKSLN